MTAAWIGEARRRDVPSIARELHLVVTKPRGTAGGAFAPCPACGAEKRHTKAHDRRLACGIRADLTGWRCMQCDASGDGIDLVARTIGGRRFAELDRERQLEVRAWFDGEPASASPAATVAASAPAQSYPPGDELAVLWAACEYAGDDDEVAAYLRSRGIDPGLVSDRDLARALPRGAVAPPWARFGGAPWGETGHRLIVPLVDDRGRMRSVLARRVTEGEPKSISPTGHTRAGLVLACPLGRQLLETGARPSWWQAEHLRVVITEGEIDALLVASSFGEDEHAPATIGIFSGSWTPSIAARIPDGVEVVIATDDDETGERYAHKVTASLGARPSIAISRWRPAA